MTTQLTSTEERCRLFAAWWDYQRLARGTREDRVGLARGVPGNAVAAVDTVRGLVDLGESDAVQFLANLNDAGTHEDEGEHVGAGPLEDLIHQHGDAVIDEIDRCARQLPSFAQALRHVWLSHGTLSQATEDWLIRWISVDTTEQPPPRE